MRLPVLWLTCFFLLLQPGEDSARITFPGGGAALQGQVTVLGVAAADGFDSYELSYTYSGGALQTWFLISQGHEQVTDGPLGLWDTTTIADGSFRLRLQVFLKDGRVLEAFVDGLRVRNYSVVETDTPTPVSSPTPEVTPAAETPSTPEAGVGESPTVWPSTTPTATATPFPTPAPLPVNPARFTEGMWQEAALRGILAALLVFGCLVIYGSIKRMRR